MELLGLQAGEEMMVDEKILRTLRAQAWERAKGELRAVAVTFFGPPSARDGQYDAYSKTMDDFIASIEANGLAE